MALVFDHNDTFINPYNFVSMTDKVDREKLTKGDHTGVIHCRLIVKDELALPDRSAPLGAENEFDFFKVNGEPVIPGSGLRGCIRSVFEAVTPSCFSVVNANILSGRLPRPGDGDEDSGQEASKPGILRFDKTTKEWLIYPAEISKTRTAGSVSRQWKNFNYFSQMKDYREGTRTTQPIEFPTRYFTVDKSQPCIVCTPRNIENFEFVLDIFLENVSGYFKRIVETLQADFKAKRDVPVFYIYDSGISDENKKLKYFSPAQVSRTVYNDRVPDLLGEHKPCDGAEDAYCPVCRLFGTLGKKAPLASRVRFSDAVLVTKQADLISSEKWLPELSSPKITSVEFYSLNSENQRGNGHKMRTKNVARWTYDSDGTKLRGRKFYFHSPAQAGKVPSDEEKKRRIKTVTIKAKNDKSCEFKFDLFFDQISKTELRQLLWVLTFGENDENGKLLHKLGMGRPVGYGSVKIVVDCVQERTVVQEKETDKLTDYKITNNGFDFYGIDAIVDQTEEGKSVLDLTVQAAQELLRIADDRYLSHAGEVCYPKADDGKNKKNSTAPHLWFSTNRTAQGTFAHLLPTLSEDKSALALPSAKASRLIGAASSRSTQQQNGQRHNQQNYSRQTFLPSSSRQAPPQQSRRAPDASVDRIVCKCGTTNYRYFPNSRNERPGWKTGICYKCGKELW